MSPNQNDSTKNCQPDLNKNILGPFASSESSNKSQKERTEIVFSENNLKRWKYPVNEITVPACNYQLQSGSYRHGISNQYYSQNLYPLPSKPTMVLKKNVSENEFFSSPSQVTIETENNVKESIHIENYNQQQFKVKEQIQMENSFPSLSSESDNKSPIFTENEYVPYLVPNLLSPLPDDNPNFNAVEPTDIHHQNQDQQQNFSVDSETIEEHTTPSEIEKKLNIVSTLSKLEIPKFIIKEKTKEQPEKTQAKSYENSTACQESTVKIFIHTYESKRVDRTSNQGNTSDKNKSMTNDLRSYYPSNQMEQNGPNIDAGNSSASTPPSTLTKKNLPQITFWTYMKNCRTTRDSAVSPVEYEIILEDLDNDPFTISDENKENDSIVINKQPNYFEQIKDYLEPCDSPPLVHIPGPIIFPIIPNKIKYKEHETKLEKRESNYSNTNEQTNCGTVDALNQKDLQHNKNQNKANKSSYEALHNKPNNFSKLIDNLESSNSVSAISKSTSESKSKKQNETKKSVSKQTKNKTGLTVPVIHPYPSLYPQYQNLLGTDYRDPFVPNHVYPDFSQISSLQHFNPPNMFSYPYSLFFPHAQSYHPNSFVSQKSFHDFFNMKRLQSEQQNVVVNNNSGLSYGHPGSSNLQDFNQKDMYSSSQEATSSRAQQSYTGYNINLKQKKPLKSDDIIKNNKSLGCYGKTIFPSSYQKPFQTTPRQVFPNPLEISPPNFLPDFSQNLYYQNYKQHKKDVDKAVQGNTLNREKTKNVTLNNYNSFPYQSVIPQNNEITKRFNFHYKNYDEIKETKEHFMSSEDSSRVLEENSRMGKQIDLQENVDNNKKMSEGEDIRKRRRRTQFTCGQLNRLEFFFRYNRRPSLKDREKLSRETMLTPKTINSWFHNKKMKLKRQQEKLNKQIK